MIDLFSFILLNFLGVISPGPDFAIVTHYGLSGSRRAAFFATFGIGVALLVHVFYCVTGVAVLLSSSPQVLLSIRLLGGAYLFYLGLKIYPRASKSKKATSMVKRSNAFAVGFFTNLLNPKATVFLLSLFGLFANAMDTLGMKIAFALSIPLIAISWFSLLSFLITHPTFLPFLQEKQKLFESVMSILLVTLGIVGIVSSGARFFLFT